VAAYLKKEMQSLGWQQADVILFTGDAYVDHPSFGAAVIGRVMEAEGLKVAIVPQPNWQDDLRDFKKLGPPRLFFAVTAAIWIQWLTIILQVNANGPMMPILLRAGPASAPIMLLLFIRIFLSICFLLSPL
jgi:hypothetical protein